MTASGRGSQPGSGGSSDAVQAPRSIEELFVSAVGHHQRGQIPEAEALYRRILAINPHHTECLHYVGVAALQQGRHHDAINQIGQSLALDERNAEAHYHLGLAFAGLRMFEEAASENRRAIALKPNYLEAHMNLGNALKECGRTDEAANCYEHAIALNPNLAFAHYNLANLLVDKREFEAAIKSYERALAGQPNFPQAQQNFGAALLLQGRFDDAITKFDAALKTWPNFVEALLGRATALLLKGAARDALPVVCRALDINPTDDAKLLFVDCIRTLDRNSFDPRQEKYLIAAITEPWCRPPSLAAFASDLVLATGAADVSAQVASAEGDFILARSQLETLAADPLLLALLENMPIVNPRLEQILTAARHTLLEMVAANPASVSESLLGFSFALARHCFVNEYVFDITDDERTRADAQRDRLVAALDAKTAPMPFLLAVVAAYFPLGDLAGSERLLEQPWSTTANALLGQQVRNSRLEWDLREAIPRLTPVEDSVSVKVQLQYEQNPYPRWVKIPRLGKAVPLDAFIRKSFPYAPIRPTGITACDVLVAGCGTGQESLEFAVNIKDAKILAVDLSKSSLSHAKRKALELAIQNIDFGQADILKLSELSRTFDLIVARGVLHHMTDPFAAWRDLMALVRPNGLMMIGLYSEAARQNIVAAREFVAMRGLRASAVEIRRARREILSLPDTSPVKTVIHMSDFFSTSECRDLLFHVQERRLTIPQIKKFIDESDAKFLGFQINSHVIGQYIARFPHDPALTDLDSWHAFEMDNPRAFISMYQFLIQLPQSA